jgi:hypothetical protein
MKIAMIGSGSGKLVRRKDDALAPANNLSLAPTGRALVRQLTYNVEMINHLKTADKAGCVMQRNDAHGRWRLDDAKPYHFRHLPLAERADAAERFLYGIIIPLEPEVMHEQATAMLSYLFGAKGRRRDEEAALKLAACIDIFDPANNELADTLQLWSKVPGHPLILALAIKNLMANKIFEPEEAELREALTDVHDEIYGRQ